MTSRGTTGADPTHADHAGCHLFRVS